MRCERGQATIEWVGLVLLASLILGALVTALPSGEARSYGASLAGRVLCAMKGGGCDADGDAALRAGAAPDTELVSQDEVPEERRVPSLRIPRPPDSALGLREGLWRVRRQGLTPFGQQPGGGPLRQTPAVECEAWWCDVVIEYCEARFTDREGEALCKAKAAAEAKPDPVSKFVEDRVGGCITGAVGAKAFSPFVEELFDRDAIRSLKNAKRALESGARRAKDEVFKGKVKPGVVGCVGGAVGF